MPDKTRKLSQAEKEHVAKILTEKKATKECPICGNPTWAIGENLVLHSLFGSGGFMIGAGFPSVLVACNNCAYFRFHSAMLFGFAQPESAPPSSTEVEKKPEGSNA